MPKAQQATRAKRQPDLLWKWEIAASIGSLTFLVGMVIVLAVYNGKEIFSWHGVTLNAVISVLSTVSKALLLFALSEGVSQWKWIAFSKEFRPLIDLERVDSASRGPLGGLKWLWISSWTQISPLQLGALITLLAIAVDPFSQQLVQYRQDIKSSVDDAATIVRAQRYSKGTALVPSVLPITMTAIADYSMQAGIFNALVQPYDALVQQTPFTCPTGNCTYPPFESLAICSACINVTSHLSRYVEPSNLYNDLYKRIAYKYITLNATSFELPNGLYINNVNGIPYYEPEDYPSSNVIEAIYMTSFGTGNASRTNGFRDSQSLLWDMSFIKMHAPSSDSARSNGQPNVSVEAVEYALFYCVNQYSSSVRNGILYETETLMRNATRQPNSWELMNYTPSNLDGIVIDNQSVNSLEFDNSTSSWRRTDLMFGNEFNLSWAAVNSMSSQFQSQFTAVKPINTSDHQNYSREFDYTPINGFYKNQINSGDPGLVDYSPSVMQILYDSTNLHDTFRRLARGMSNAIRTGADDGAVQVGSSGVITTYYRIQWPWIALHIVVIAGGVIFLFTTMFETRRAGVPTWKSSALAPLSKTNEIGDVLVGAVSIKEMETRASQHFLQLFPTRAQQNQAMKPPVLVAVTEHPSHAASEAATGRTSNEPSLPTGEGTQNIMQASRREEGTS